MHFLVLLAIFILAYFGMVLPLFQFISHQIRGRRFIIRLGAGWKISNPEHRWDVFLSFVSFLVTLGLSLFILDIVFPMKEAGF